VCEQLVQNESSRIRASQINSVTLVNWTVCETETTKDFPL